jgi:hypothetical protein
VYDYQVSSLFLDTSPAHPEFSLGINELSDPPTAGLTRTTRALTLNTVRRNYTLAGETQVISAAETSETPADNRPQRIGNRRKIRVPGRLTWRDASGTLRFVSVMTRDISDVDAFVECEMPASIPLYRLVHFQIERPSRDGRDLPAALQQGKVLSAVYRVGPYRTSSGTPQGYALRLLVEPKRNSARTREALAVAN